MTGYDWLDVLIGIGVALLITWLLFIAALAIGRPKGSMLTESLRLLPDLLRLLRRIAADKHQAAGVRVRLLLLLAYLAFPIDLIPEAILGPLGLVDDAGVVAAVVLFVYKLVKARRILADGGIELGRPGRRSPWEHDRR